MGMLQRLKQFFTLPEPQKLNDSVFGVISLTGTNFWEGSVYFAPIGEYIGVFMDASAEGPTKKQRSFYREFETRYETLIPEIADLLYENFVEWKPDFQREDVWKEFRLEAIDIRNCEVAPLNWELSYACASDDGHSFDIQMSDWNVEGLAMNG